jgi:hypothetical protein
VRSTLHTDCRVLSVAAQCRRIAPLYSLTEPKIVPPTIRRRGEIPRAYLPALWRRTAVAAPRRIVPGLRSRARRSSSPPRDAASAPSAPGGHRTNRGASSSSSSSSWAGRSGVVTTTGITIIDLHQHPPSSSPFMASTTTHHHHHHQPPPPPPPPFPALTSSMRSARAYLLTTGSIRSAAWKARCSRTVTVGM